MTAPKGKKQSFTVMGITVSVDTSVDVDPDYRALRDAARGDDLAMVRFQDDTLHDLLGDKYDETLDALQGDDKRLSTVKVGDFFAGLTEQINALKN